MKKLKYWKIVIKIWHQWKKSKEDCRIAQWVLV